MFAGQILNQDDMTVLDWGMIYGSTIYLIAHINYCFNVWILLKTPLKCKTITVNLRFNDLIEKVKFQIQDKTGISYDTIRLFLNDKELNDNEALIDTDISLKTTITAYIK